MGPRASLWHFIARFLCQELFYNEPGFLITAFHSHALCECCNYVAWVDLVTMFPSELVCKTLDIIFGFN